MPQVRGTGLRRPTSLRNFLVCLCRQRSLGFDIAPRGCEILLEPRRPLALLLQRLLRLRGAALARLFQPGRFLTCFRRQRSLGFDIAPRGCEILLEPRRPLALLLQRLLEFRGAALARLFQPGRLLTCFRRQRSLGFDIAPRGCEILLEPRRPLALLLQRLRLRSPALARLFQPGRFLTCFRRQRSLGFDIAPRGCEILLQSHRSLALLLQRLRLRGAALARLFQSGRFLTCFRRQRSLGFDIAPRGCEILLQPHRSLALLLQRYLQLGRATLARFIQPGSFLQSGSFLDGLRCQRLLGFDLAPSGVKTLHQPLGPIMLLLETLQQLDVAPCKGKIGRQ
ncbi:hypothetical protein [Bradyrhizobium sp. CCGUVB23]|uniref:hypothetical protein n=1 Tax=Bradyrhizobium sp. CCGUVB23 TaxID=2949630 RepID=UPI0020B27624|nr:hypothetical protein [Bradyrhizobium sp. CCGUVB23]MCP3459292.1 hypothetical protein [Bradyrhizobium sp. CCGUVB23]